MVERTVRIRGYSYTNSDGKKVVAKKREVIEISEEEAERGDALGYFLTEGEEVEVSAIEEDNNENESDGGSEGDWTVLDASDDELDLWVAGEDGDAPTVEEIVDVADDSESAERLLASETRVAAKQERAVRKTLETQLSQIMGSSN